MRYDYKKQEKSSLSVTQVHKKRSVHSDSRWSGEKFEKVLGAKRGRKKIDSDVAVLSMMHEAIALR